MNCLDKKQWVLAAVLGIVTLMVYWPAMNAGFIWDDDLLLTENQRIHSPSGLREIWSLPLDAEFYPITWTSFWLEWRLWGMNATGYHVTNVLLHLLAAILVWRVLERLGIPGAWLAALIFCIHPVNAESVAWISERKNTLSLVFYALTVLTFLRFDSDGKTFWYWLSLGAFLAALLCKTSGVGLPVVLLLCAWRRRNRIERRDLFLVLPFFVLALGFAALSIWLYDLQAIKEPSLFSAKRPWWFRLGAAGHVFWFYLGKTLLPFKVMAFYPLWRFDRLTPLFWEPTVAALVAVGVAWHFRHTWGKPVLFALLYCGAMLFPVLGVFNAPYIGRSPVVSDHLQYLATIGVIALVVATVMKLPDTFRNPLAGAVVVVLAVLSWQRCLLFQDPVRFWNDTLAKNPQSARAHYNLAVHYDKQRQYEKALERYRAAVAFDPTYGKARNNLGKVLIREGKLSEAIEHFRAAVQLLPGQGELHYNYGLALFLAKRFPETVGELRQAVRYSPRNANAHACLAAAYALLGRAEKARQHQAEAKRLHPQPPDFLRLLSSLSS